MKSWGEGHVQTFVRGNIFFVEATCLFGLFVVRADALHNTPIALCVYC